MGVAADMAKRLCMDCGKLTTATRCPSCTTAWNRPRNAAKDARRGTATARGYDAEHHATRKRLLPFAYNTPCPRCGEVMLLGDDLDLGHEVPLRDDPTSRADRIEHALCNRGSND